MDTNLLTEVCALTPWKYRQTLPPRKRLGLGLQNPYEWVSAPARGAEPYFRLQQVLRFQVEIMMPDHHKFLARLRTCGQSVGRRSCPRFTGLLIQERYALSMCHRGFNHRDLGPGVWYIPALG